MGPEGQPEQGRAEVDVAAELAALRARVEALEFQMQRLAQGRPAPGPAAVTNDAPVRVVVPPPPAAAAVSAAAAPPRESLENRVGSQLFNWIGIVALLFGATWFLKLAIDNQWIGPVGRVLAGLIAGAGLILWSERFRRRSLAAFSYSLKAIGSGVLYLSLWASFQLYHQLPASAVLGAMVLVTAWNAYMAWVQDAELLAGFALVGAFATPLLLSTGGNHEAFLFVYLLAIDVATVALVRLKHWPRLLLGAFPATVVYFIGWYAGYFSADALGVTSVFIALFFAVFASVPLRTTDSDSSDLIEGIFLPLGSAVFGALAFYSVLQDSGHHSWLPWLMVIFAAIYLGLMRLPQSAVAAAIHLSLAIVFLTIAIPLKASGRWITVSWLVEGSALVWVAARLEAAGDGSAAQAHRVLRWLGVGALALGCVGVLVQPLWFFASPATAFWNTRFATALVGIAAFAITAWIALGAMRSEHKHAAWQRIAGGSIIAINVIALLSCVREIEAYWSHGPANAEAGLQQALSVSAFLMVYGAVLLAVGFWKRSAFVRWQALILIVFTIAKTFLYDIRSLSQGYRVVSLLGLGALLMAVSFAYQKDWLALRDTGSVAAGEERG